MEIRRISNFHVKNHFKNEYSKMNNKIEDLTRFLNMIIEVYREYIVF